jgi:hypothetical protein
LEREEAVRLHALARRSELLGASLSNLVKGKGRFCAVVADDTSKQIV